jgi:SPP1 gp7 family putative phage head morphogenesis protein
MTDNFAAVDLSSYDTLIDKIAHDLHSGKLKPELLNQELISKTYNDLASGAKVGYGKKWDTFPGDGKGSLPNELKKNLYVFSGAKSYAQLEDLNRLLYDQNGKIRPFNEFSVYAKKNNREYNVNFLQSEYQTALTAAQMAQKWEKLQETKDLFPNLKYRSVGDNRVRPEHEKLNGIIRPIDDPFWSKYYPPLDWRCRCDVVATAEDTTGKDDDDLPEPTFKGNVGKDKEIFTKKGSFFKLLNTSKNATRNVELSKLNAPTETVFKAKNGKKVEASIYAHETDLQDNIAIGKIIADQLKFDVLIRTHLDTNIAIGQKNGEYFINGNLSDLKSNFKKDNYKSINSAFKAARDQNLQSIVFDFTKSFADLNLIEVNRWVLSNINKERGKQFKEIILIYNKKAVRVTRESILKKELIKELEKLKANS